MQSKTKNCQNCKKDFTIEPEDFNFYKKIKVPPPTWCPECRLVRRLIWRNERALYKIPCAMCGESIFSMYHSRSPFPVYCLKCWYGDDWSPLDYGEEINWNKPFLEQVRDLMGKVPRAALWQTSTQNAEFANFSRDNKDAYLSYSVIESEKVYYSKNTDNSEEIFDSLDIYKSEHCYEVNAGAHNYNCQHSLYIRNCIDSSFLFDCANCTNCFLCSNLRNKSYYFKNQKYSKEEYQNKIKEYSGSYRAISSAQKEFNELMQDAIHKYAQIVASSGSSGNDLADCKNAKESFNGFEMENVKYVLRCLMTRDCMDITNIGRGTELIYESVSGGAENSQNLKFIVNSPGESHNVEYTERFKSSFYLFGCAGLFSKNYCILNKQYTKEEYEALAPKIVEHMDAMPYIDQKGRIYKYGEFFPPEFTPFAYNETIAQEYFPLTKTEALGRGYQWKDNDERNFKIDIKSTDLPDTIAGVDESIVGKVIECEHKGACAEQCTEAFKIIIPELQFYKRMNLPLPRLCPNCRHYQRFKQRNPLKLWHRSCMCDKDNHFHGKAKPCRNEFETPYAPDRPERVFCGSCYNKEIY